jgi:hypothetical protein
MSKLLQERKKGVIKVIQELDVLVVEVSTFVTFFFPYPHCYLAMIAFPIEIFAFQNI